MKRLFLYSFLSATAFWGLCAGASMLFGALGSLFGSLTYVLALLLVCALTFGLSYSVVLTCHIRSLGGVTGMILLFWHLGDFCGHILANLPFLAEFWAGFIAGAMQTTALWGILAAARENWRAES